MSAVQTFRGPLRNNMHKQINSMSADTLSHVRLDNGDKKQILLFSSLWGGVSMAAIVTVNCEAFDVKAG